MNKKILIVGLGLIGGSYAKGLSKKGYEVHAISRKQETIDFAIENGLITEGRVDFDESYISQFDQIVLSLYPKVLLSWISKYKSYFSKGTIITDVTGIKGQIIYKIRDELPDGVEFIGAHPMAGKEVYGVKNADETIFKKANYIITPLSDNSEKSLSFARNLAEELEFKNIEILTPEEHDQMIAFLSQLTHCIAVSLMTCKDNTNLSKYTGDSFRDLTRIANINEDMWSELFLMNKEKLVSEIDSFVGEIKELRDYIQNEDAENIKNKMRLSSKRRSYFNK